MEIIVGIIGVILLGIGVRMLYLESTLKKLLWEQQESNKQLAELTEVIRARQNT